MIYRTLSKPFIHDRLHVNYWDFDEVFYMTNPLTMLSQNTQQSFKKDLFFSLNT